MKNQNATFEKLTDGPQRQRLSPLDFYKKPTPALTQIEQNREEAMHRSLAIIEDADEDENKAQAYTADTPITLETLVAQRIVSEYMGRSQMATAIGKVVSVTTLIDLQNIKNLYKSRKINPFPATNQNGEVVMVTTWANFWQVIQQRSRESVDLDLINFNQLGATFFESMSRIGLGPAKMRELRQIPADEKDALILIAESGNKEAFIELAESIIINHAEGKKKLTKSLEDSTQQLEASRKRVEILRGEKEKLEEQLDRIAVMEPDEAVAKARADIATYTEKLRVNICIGMLRSFKDLQEAREKMPFPDTMEAEHIHFMAAAMTELQFAINQVRAEFGLPETKDASQVPDWARS